ncbi:hypothetical protein Ddye_002088 [Dipteronia dyeriana]|uniref:Uncharacterized protein n=1 Tax=Dipteronia dyeriana TaxID=168575 RepID=A0AAD9XPV0_9ROSI|nr:hypothetical protein Ddye_002088 [Dipteronia dyeriana]
MLDPPLPPYPPQSFFRQPPPPMSSRQEPRSRGGDRISDLLKAVQTLPVLLEDIVKKEVTPLPDVVRGLLQEIQSTRGQINDEVPLTIVRDKSIDDEEEVDPLVVSNEKEMVPSGEKDVLGEKEMGGAVLSNRDLRTDYNYASEEDRSIRVRLRSAYCKSPFIDPTWASATKCAKDKRKYKAFKKKNKTVRQNVGTEESVDHSFFLELEDPKQWLSM